MILIAIVVAAWVVFGLSNVVSDYQLALQKPEIKDAFRRFAHHMLTPVVWVGSKVSGLAKRAQDRLKL